VRRPNRDEAGFVGGFAGLLFGVLTFLFGTLLVAYGWAVVQTKAAVVDAARQAARTYVEAPGAMEAYNSARDAADASLAAKGRNPDRAGVSVASGPFGRCRRVTVTVSYPAPVVVVPLAGLLGGSTVRAEHSEIVDPYRTGLPGSAACT
jgi:Flp pilus assembly protein TadG